MKAEELRIGNIILLDDEEIILTGIKGNTVFWKNGFDMTGLTGSEIKPIPLTEEWLLKFGFVQFPASNLWDKEDFWAIYKKVNTDEWRCDHLEMQFKYVHQLQNLYFALTGEELQLKES